MFTFFLRDSCCSSILSMPAMPCRSSCLLHLLDEREDALALHVHGRGQRLRPDLWWVGEPVLKPSPERGCKRWGSSLRITSSHGGEYGHRGLSLHLGHGLRPHGQPWSNHDEYHLLTWHRSRQFWVPELVAGIASGVVHRVGQTEEAPRLRQGRNMVCLLVGGKPICENKEKELNHYIWEYLCCKHCCSQKIVRLSWNEFRWNTVIVTFYKTQVWSESILKSFVTCTISSNLCKYYLQGQVSLAVLGVRLSDDDAAGHLGHGLRSLFRRWYPNLSERPSSTMRQAEVVLTTFVVDLVVQVRDEQVDNL